MLSNKTLVLLVALLVALLAALRFSDRLSPGGADAPDSTLLPNTDGRATSVRIKTDSLEISLLRPSARWVFAPPSSGRADTRRVDLVLDTVLRAVALDRISQRQRESRGLDLKDFGLLNPRAQISLEGSGWNASLAIGADTPDGTSVFVMVDGRSDVAVVDRAILDLLPESLDELRDRTVFSEPGFEISNIEIRQIATNAPSSILLSRETDGLWSIRKPYECPVHATHVTLLATTLSNATVERFVHTPGTNETPTEVTAAAIAHGLGPEETNLRLSVWTRGDSTPSEFAFGDPDPTDEFSVFAYSAVDGTIFTLDRAVTDALKMPLDELRERRPFPFAPNELCSVSLKSGDGPFSLVRSDPASPWSIAEPSRQPASQEAANRFVEHILSLSDKTAEIIPREGFSPTGAVVRIELGLTPPVEPIVAFFSRRPATSQEGVQDLVLSFPSRGIAHIISGETVPVGMFGSTALAALRDPSILEQSSENIVSLSRHVSEGATQTVRKNTDGTWLAENTAQKKGPSSDKPNLNAIGAILDALKNLTASETVALFTSDSAAYGLLPPRIELSVITIDEEQPIVILQLGNRRTDGSVLLRIKGKDAVFALPPETAAALSAPLFQ